MSYSFENLEVWQKSRVLVREIYEITGFFPIEERYGLTNQMRRSVISISSNIAEGSTRFSSKDKGRFYEIAYGSLIELLNQLILSTDLNYYDQRKLGIIREQIDTISKMLIALYNSTKKKLIK